MDLVAEKIERDTFASKYCTGTIHMKKLGNTEPEEIGNTDPEEAGEYRSRRNWGIQIH